MDQWIKGAMEEWRKIMQGVKKKRAPKQHDTKVKRTVRDII